MAEGGIDFVEAFEGGRRICTRNCGGGIYFVWTIF